MSKTKVTLCGFRLHLANNISIGEFFQHLELFEDKDLGGRWRKNILFTDVVDRYITGIVLSMRDDKSGVATERDEKNNLIIRKSTLLENQSHTDVNVFCINPYSMNGLYFSYFGSASLKAFEQVLRKIHSDLRRSKISEKVKELSNLDPHKKTEAIRRKADEFYAGDLKLVALTTSKDFEQTAALYAEITSLEVATENATPNAPMFSPIAGMTTASKMQFRFSKLKTAADILSGIRQAFAPWIGPSEKHRMKLIGKSLSGEDLSLLVGENTDQFGYMDFDEYIDKLPAKILKEYTSCDVLNFLIKKIKSLTAVFGEIPQNSDWKIPSAKDFKNTPEREAAKEPA